LRGNIRVPSPRINFTLDADEKELIKKGADMDKEQIWAILEKKRFQELQHAAISLTGDLLVQQRCPKCTLMPPC
jgi:hypothetical protein